MIKLPLSSGRTRLYLFWHFHERKNTYLLFHCNLKLPNPKSLCLFDLSAVEKTFLNYIDVWWRIKISMLDLAVGLCFSKKYKIQLIGHCWFPSATRSRSRLSSRYLSSPILLTFSRIWGSSVIFRSKSVFYGLPISSSKLPVLSTRSGSDFGTSALRISWCFGSIFSGKSTKISMIKFPYDFGASVAPVKPPRKKTNYFG